MPINSKTKGKVGELELAHYLTDAGHPARRGQQFQGTPDSPDIVCPTLSQYNLECKRKEKLSLYQAMEQAESDCGEGQSPVVIHRRNKKRWVSIMYLDDWLELVSEKKTSI